MTRKPADLLARSFVYVTVPAGRPVYREFPLAKNELKKIKQNHHFNYVVAVLLVVVLLVGFVVAVTVPCRNDS